MPASVRSSLCVVLVALIVGCVNIGAGAASASVCDRVASPNGSESAAGTVSQPYGTVQALVDALQPGQTGCLRGGVYEEDVTIRHGGAANAPIVVRSYPGETATLVGRLRLAQGSDYTVISDLDLVGIEHGNECSKMCASPTVDANHTSWIGDDVTNDHVDTICFLLGDSGGVWGSANYTTIEDDRIHDCGALPATNYDHGIYVEESYGSKILDNLIDNNADRGIQLYPQAVATMIRGNVIVDNGEGVDFGASGSQSSDDNTVENNVIADSNVLYNVLSAYGPGDQVGTGNVVRGNCIGGGAYDNAANPGGIRFDHSGFELEGNVLAKPVFVHPTQGDFVLARHSQCAGVLGSGVSRVIEAMATEQPAGRSPGHAITVTIRARWAVRAGQSVARVNGIIVHGAAGAHLSGVRCQARQPVIIRALRHGLWSGVGLGWTRPDCTFTVAGRVGRSRQVRVEAIVVGVGRSNVVTMRSH